jgi:bisphosphoglycerate-independent phosphoglycerate mutase (AlkP superfamily)
LEFLNNKDEFDDKIAAFTTWDVLPYILNTDRNHIYVSTPLPSFIASNDNSKPIYDELAQNKIPSNDEITFTSAFKHLKDEKPKLLLLAFDATDEFAHKAKYFEYLKAANTIDNYIKEIWKYCQKDPQYRNKTSIIITTDHGRGDVKKKQWTSHGFGIRGSHAIWLAAIGPDIMAKHELKMKHQIHQNQIAATVAKLFGYTFENGHKIGEAIDLIVE